MAGLVDLLVERPRGLRLLLGGMTTVLPAAIRGSMTRWLASKGFVGQQSIGLHMRQLRIGALQVTGLTGDQKEAERVA